MSTQNVLKSRPNFFIRRPMMRSLMPRAWVARLFDRFGQGFVEAAAHVPATVEQAADLEEQPQFLDFIGYVQTGHGSSENFTDY